MALLSLPIEKATQALASAKRVLFITGAGISAESGLPTYRGIGGLYTDMDTPDDLPIEVVLSGAYFREQPAVSWKYIRQVEEACRGATFNAGHQAIADFEQYVETVIVLTQNVDGFHRDAGSTDVIDLHGDIRDLICTECDWTERVGDFSGLDALPLCPSCGAVIRPDVVLFGELLPEDKVVRMLSEQERGFDAVVSVGTSSLFPYIAAPVVEAADAGVPTIEINPENTTISHLVDVKIAHGAGETLPAILERLRN